MKIRMDRLYNAVQKACNHVTYRSEEMKSFIIELTINEPDLTKGIPAAICTAKVDYETKEAKITVMAEIYDEMDNVDPVVTRIIREQVKPRS